ncbi:hypothetical protein [Microcoleus asticus]|uniref:Uncharacterized protein n=1 Tax=Microcoleus asticus IPMA8 TaxID=2563858 RepID=A0ABX2CZ44_9CYAN|nr:hypothetical protein [Microcoleus asticus]NQE35667.1 hypothetical protein [Microcoleus asticus IPMA8]
MNTSDDRIRELQEEYPWLKSLKISLVNLKAPMQQEIFLEAVKSTRWSPEKQPPVTNSEGILQYLLQLALKGFCNIYFNLEL